MSKVDEAKLNQAMKTISEYFHNVAELSMKGERDIASLFKASPTPSTIRKDLNFFPDPYNELVEIRLSGDNYEVYPVKFLGTDNFKEISDIVRKLGGSYVHGDKAHGVKAHFAIPKGEPKE